MKISPLLFMSLEQLAGASPNIPCRVHPGQTPLPDILRIVGIRILNVGKLPAKQEGGVKWGRSLKFLRSRKRHRFLPPPDSMKPCLLIPRERQALRGDSCNLENNKVAHFRYLHSACMAGELRDLFLIEIDLQGTKPGKSFQNRVSLLALMQRTRTRRGCN